MSIKLIPSIAVSLVLGFALGCVPVLNEHLHWNLWFIVPISGLLLGALMGWIQFAICYRVNQKVGGVIILVLAVAAMIGYAAVDYGVYVSAKVTISGVEGIPDGEYSLRDLVTFREYMRSRLGASSISTSSGDAPVKIGATGTTISYIVDLGGALLGAAGLLFCLSQRRPYCDRCGKYKEREEKYEILFGYEENLVNEIFGKIRELTLRAVYNEMASYCRELAEKYQDNDGDVKIVVEQKRCTDCGERTILGSVFRLGKKEWKEVDELGFSLTSETSESVSAGI